MQRHVEVVVKSGSVETTVVLDGLIVVVPVE